MVAEKALVKFKIAAIEEFPFFFFLLKEKNFSSLICQSLSKPLFFESMV